MLAAVHHWEALATPLCQSSFLRIALLTQKSKIVESCFEQATEFIPERWYSKPEMVKNKKAYAPFSLGLPLFHPSLTQIATDENISGRYGCIGKNLALQELRCVTALLESKYDVSFPPGEDGRSVEQDTRDQFTSNPGELRVVFRGRDNARSQVV